VDLYGHSPIRFLDVVLLGLGASRAPETSRPLLLAYHHITGAKQGLEPVSYINKMIRDNPKHGCVRRDYTTWSISSVI